MSESKLRARLRLMVITRPDPRGGPLVDVVARCVEAGATAVQLRDKAASTRGLYESACALADVVRGRGALLLVNDRFDVALAAGADGVHLGPDDVPVDAARAILPPDFVLGYSTDDPAAAKRAVAAGASYLGVGALFGTISKPGLEDEAIGIRGLRAVVQSVDVPCVGIGGITPDNAEPVAATGAGVAVLGAVMDAERPEEVVRELKRAIDRARGVS